MGKVNLFDFQVLLKSAFHPLTPVFVGSWRGQFSTKWRGVSAELSYNTYLRNGWIVIDTGVKSETGTPIVEFSSWEPYVSHSNITFPNILSYKFFFKKAFWRVGFLTRTSVVANEEWAGSLPNYLSVYNNTKRGGFFRKNNWNLLLSGKPLSLINQRFIFFQVGSLNRFYEKSTAFTWNFNRFYLFESLGLVNRKVRINTLLTSRFFETITYGVVSRLTKVGIFATSKNLVGLLIKRRNVSLYDILFKMSTLFLVNAERSAFGGFTNFFSVILHMLIEDLVFLASGAISCSNNLVNFLCQKFTRLFENSKLNFSFFLRVSGYAFSSIVRFLRSYACAGIFVSSNNYFLNLNLISSKLRRLRQVQVLSSRVTPLLNASNPTLRDFLQGFAPRFFTKKRVNRGVPTRQTQFFTRKIGKFSNKSGVKGVSLVGTQVYPRLVKYRRKPVTRFKLSLFKKQFSFLHFWVINFFAFFAVKPNSKKLAWMGTRLKFFFRSFLKFLKFYSFTSGYFSLAFQEIFRQRTRFLIKFNSLRLYFWFLLKRARGLLCSFWSFSSKLSRNYFTAIDRRIEKAFPNFSFVALGLIKPSVLATSSEALRPLGSQLNILPGEVRALRVAFLGLHSSFLPASLTNEGGLTLKVRNFLRFTLLVRRAAFYVFNRQLGIAAGTIETVHTPARFYDLKLNSLLRIIIEKKFLRVFLMPRRGFINFLGRLRNYFTAGAVKNSKCAINAKRWVGLIAALNRNGGLHSIPSTFTKTFWLARRLILRRARQIGYVGASGYAGVTSGVVKLLESAILDSNLIQAKQLFLRKTLIGLSKAVTSPLAHYSALRGIRYLMDFPLMNRSVNFLPLGLDKQISFNTHELKRAGLKIRAFIIRFSQIQAQINRYVSLRSRSNVRLLSRKSMFLISHFYSESKRLGQTSNGVTEFSWFTRRISDAIILGRTGVLRFNLMHFALVNNGFARSNWAAKLFSLQALTVRQLSNVVLGQKWERLGKVSLLNFFMQMRSFAKTLAQRISKSKFGEVHYSLQPTAVSKSFITKRELNRAIYLVNTFYTFTANFTDVKSADLTLLKVAKAWIPVRSNGTTGVRVLRAFCLRFVPFFMVKRVIRKNILRKWDTSLSQNASVFGFVKRNFRVTFLNRRKVARNTAILPLNLCKSLLTPLNLVFPRLLRSSKHLVVAKMFSLTRLLAVVPGEVKKSCSSTFVRKVLVESAVFNSSNLLGDVGRMQEIAFRKVRAIRKILLRSNARRLGIFPKRSKHLKKMYWKLVNSGKLEPVVPDYINSQRSIFDRRNRQSMELSAQRAKKRFRFTTVKLQFTVRKQLWSQLILLLDRIKKVMRLFRVKIWRRRFYRLFRAGRWSIRKKVKKKFIRLIVKAAYFLQKIQYGAIPVRILTLVARVSVLPFNHTTHNSYALLRSFYLRILSRVAVLRAQNYLILRHKFFKDVKLNFLYKFIYWFVKKISMFLLSLRAVFFNLAYLTNKASVLALTGVHESCAFLRSSCLGVAPNTVYNFYNSALFNNKTASQSGSWLASRLTSSSALLFSGSGCTAPLLRSSLSLISNLFVSYNMFFVWKRASKFSSAMPLNWTFLIDRRVDSLKVGSVPFFFGRSVLTKVTLKRISQNTSNLFLLRRLNLARNMGARSYAKLLECVTASSRMGLKKPKVGFTPKSFGRSKLKFQKKTGKIVSRAVGMKRALRLI